MSGGITIEVPEAVPVAREVTLPSGTVAAIRKGNGRDLRMAQTAGGQPFDMGKFRYALVAQVAMIDGKKTTMEAVDAMPIDDVSTLLAACDEVNFPTREAPEVVPSS